MAAEHVTRIPAGVHLDGSPRFDVTYHGHARRPESVAEWREQRAAALAVTRGRPAADAVIALLTAEDPDVKATGKPLSPWDRWSVLQVLERIRSMALEGYPPAAGYASGLVSAWARHWGTERPARAA